MTGRLPLAQHTKASLDALYERAERAEQEAAEWAAVESADAAAGSYALRAEGVEAQLTAAADLIADHEGDDWAAHPAATALRGILDDQAPAASCSPAAPETEPNNPAATEATDLRTRLARALAGHAGSKAFLADGPEWDHMRSVWYAHADAALTELQPELAALAEYENAITWQTDCLSCARVLDSSIRETERADRLADALREALDAQDESELRGPAREQHDRWRAILDEPRPEPGVHVYLSTGCFHGDHDYCKSMTGLAGAKRPASCKKCGARYICPCHGSAEPPVHIGGRANAEDCPACTDTNPPYPFICPGPDEAAADPELTAEEARALADELGTDLYRAQDALAFVEECCVIADREQRAITTADVRTWLKGAQCGRQLAADTGFVVDPAAPPLEFVTWAGPVRHRFAAHPVTPEMERAATERARQAAADSERSEAWFAATGGVVGGTAATEATDVGAEFVQQADHPDEEALAKVEADLAAAEPTPSQRPGLRDDITRTLREHGMVHLGDQVPADEYDCCSDAVLTLLYREWPWLRAETEERDQSAATLAAITAEAARRGTISIDGIRKIARQQATPPAPRDPCPYCEASSERIPRAELGQHIAEQHPDVKATPAKERHR